MTTHTPDDRHIFMPSMTVAAMRDSRYHSTAHAVAELVDNSLDAGASRIEVLIQQRQRLASARRIWRVSELGVLDNGCGMSPATLVQALRFGGRIDSRSPKAIGKYGMGLPTSSVSQARRFDVWTWEDGIENLSHSYLDVDEVENNGVMLVPDPDSEPIPADWMGMISDIEDYRASGTLVLWKKIDRIRNRPETIFNQIEEEIGRIYRHFIHDGTASIRMATFRTDDRARLAHAPVEPEAQRHIRPNDPLYLMVNSNTPRDGYESLPDPLFEEFKRQKFEYTINSRKEEIEVIYSIAKREILGEYRGTTPGNRPYGKHARKNMGISIVREDREITLENFFVREGGGGAIPENRWWGCEVRFMRGADDLFGVDHNKQQVSSFSETMRYFDQSDGNTSQIAMDLGDEDEEDDVLVLVISDIRNTTRNMMRTVGRMFKQRPQRPSGGENGANPTTTEGQATRAATAATRALVDSGSERRNQTDNAREQMDSQARANQISDTYQSAGYEPERAEAEAARIVRDDDWYNIIPEPLGGHQMFSFISAGGVLNMKLNISHPIYEFIQSIQDSDTDLDSEEASRKIATAILAILLSWGRMEDDIENEDRRIEVQDYATNWGKMVRGVLREIQ